jgi:glutamine amidotransferase
MIAIVDYGMGNLRSVQKALEHVGAEARIATDVDQIHAADKLILPGVGAFSDAMKHLTERDLIPGILDFIDAGRPFLGICLGMQLLFEVSTEDGQHEGLGVLPGRVERFASQPGLKVPHMGWNTLDWDPAATPALLRGLGPGVSVYFVHSYFCIPAESPTFTATAAYPAPFCAAVSHNNIMATQFHPEKSQQVGLTMLRNFARM